MRTRNDGYVDRPEIDRWILSNLQSLIEVAHREMSQTTTLRPFVRRRRSSSTISATGTSAATAVASGVRKDASDTDKNGRLRNAVRSAGHAVPLAGAVHSVSDRTDVSESGAGRRVFVSCGSGQRRVRLKRSATHRRPLCALLPPPFISATIPTPDTSLLDKALNQRMAAAQKVVRLGHKLREENNLRVRQPLAELQFASPARTLRRRLSSLATSLAKN